MSTEEGPSEEKIAEAYKMNEMVDEGKITSSEASSLEKDKTPEELEAEKKAMEKLLDIEEIFDRDGVFDLDFIEESINPFTKHGKEKTINEVRNSLLTSQNYFYHNKGNNSDVLKNPNFFSISCYPFWWRELPIGDLHSKTSAEDVDTTLIISQKATESSRQNAIADNLWEDEVKEDSVPRGRDHAILPYELAQAEAYFHDQGNPDAISGVILGVKPSSETREKSLLIAKEIGEISNTPVLDSDGNMLWPKQMAKEEVIEYIKQTKAQKRKEE